MAQTKEGAQKAKARNIARYGADYYKTIGAKGGSKKVRKGFATNIELAREAGKKGGTNSKRGKKLNDVAVSYESLDSDVHDISNTRVATANKFDTEPNTDLQISRRIA